MSSKFKVQSSKFAAACFFCILLAFCLTGCSIPNLETADCTEAREASRVFYSFHYSNDTKFTKENLQQRRKYLTPELFQNLMQQPEGGKDYFTNSDEPPKAFRIGSCKAVEPNQKASLEVVLIWKTGEIGEQKEVQVETVKQDNKWLINKVENK